MQQHYSTVAQSEMRDGIAKIISLAGVREAMAMKSGLGGGIEVVSIGDKTKTASWELPPNWPTLLSFSGAGDGT